MRDPVRVLHGGALGWSMITTVRVLLPLSMAILSLGRHRLAGMLATREGAA